MTTAPPTRKRLSPLIYPAAILSLASLAWTTWSLVDLLGTGTIGTTVALGADIIWGSVIIADARGIRIAGKHWTVPALGWAALLVVATFLAWHGIIRHSPAMAAAGPFLPLGAKTIWVLALADMRDPAALTNDELHQLAAMERGMAFEEQQHRIEMRRRAMGAELQIAEVATDFDIELMRQDRARELHRRRPLELEPAPRPPQEPKVLIAAPEKPRKKQPPSDPAGPVGEPLVDVHALFGQPHAPVVYFLRNGSRVKIGVSQNLKRRVASLSLRADDVVRAEHGNQDHERHLHSRFDHLRVGDTEWFDLRDELAHYLGELTPEPFEPKAQQSSEPEAHSPELMGSAKSLVLASTQVASVEPDAQPAEVEARPFGFSAHPTAQSAQRAQAVAQVAELLAQDPGLTSGQVVELLKVSPATAKRYLREARSPRPAANEQR